MPPFACAQSDPPGAAERLLTAAEKQRKSRFQHESDRCIASNMAPNQWVGREIGYLADQRNFGRSTNF
jgi:hypothetical protein